MKWDILTKTRNTISIPVGLSKEDAVKVSELTSLCRATTSSLPISESSLKPIPIQSSSETCADIFKISESPDVL